MSAEKSLLSIFFSFLKIGLTSFGGHAALVSVLQKELVEKQKLIDEDLILDGMSIATILPGPLAVNVVTYVGYYLRGWLGAMSAMLGVLTPPFFLMVGLAFLYGRFGELHEVNGFLMAVIPVIIGLIMSLAFSLFKKNISGVWQYVIFAIVLVASFWANSHLWIVIYLIFGGVIGYFLNKKIEKPNEDETRSLRTRNHLILGVSLVVIAFLTCFIGLSGTQFQLVYEFSKVSLTLFGGGYVMIPILHEIVVESLGWLSSAEFANAIAFGQMTPGPILVSATYVGFKVGGFVGAILATFGIFVPSATLMIIIGQAFAHLKGNSSVQAVMAGIKSAVIALIVYSGWILFQSQPKPVLALAGILASFLIVSLTRVNYFILVIIAGFLGVLLLG